MSLWEKFEKENCNLKNNNIRIRIDKSISKKLRKEYLSEVNPIFDTLKKENNNIK